MLDYIDSLTSDDWMIKVLVCPVCQRPLRTHKSKQVLLCQNCGGSPMSWEYLIDDGISTFNRPPLDKREYAFEMNRYKGIAIAPPHTYDGFIESMPNTRNRILKPLLKHHGAYLNLGQGFGLLEETMTDIPKMCLDSCLEFLRYCVNKDIRNTRYVMGFGEQMPFKDNYFPAVVSDSVFQTLVDQREFLVECARVLKPKGAFVLTITYQWNYPRKPQAFPADNPELLERFLEELGIPVDIKYYDLKSESEVWQDDGDFMVVTGHKR